MRKRWWWWWWWWWFAFVVWLTGETTTTKSLHLYIYIYIYVCVYVSDRERIKPERKDWKRQTFWTSFSFSLDVTSKMSYLLKIVHKRFCSRQADFQGLYWLWVSSTLHLSYLVVSFSIQNSSQFFNLEVSKYLPMFRFPSCSISVWIIHFIWSHDSKAANGGAL